eukprot:8384026-Alexandrium_andersonii.AAC.1
MVDTLEKLAQELLLKWSEVISANGDNNSYEFLNKPKVLMQDRIYCGSDPQHVSKVLELLELENCRPVATPGLDSWGVSDGDELELGFQQAGLYKRCVGILIY